MQLLLRRDYGVVDIAGSLYVGEVIANASILILASVVYRGLSGAGGNYIAQVFVDDAMAQPDRTITIAAGIVNARFQSRHVFVPVGSSYRIFIQGLAGESAVGVEVILADATPVDYRQIVDGVAPPLVTVVDEAVQSAVDHMNIAVHPETRVLGPCKADVRSGKLAAQGRVRSGYLMPRK